MYSPEPGARGARRAALAEHVACGMWHVACGAGEASFCWWLVVVVVVLLLLLLPLRFSCSEAAMM